MANQFQLAGAQETKQVHFAPIFTNRFFQGLWTQRNPLRDAGSTRVEEKYIGTRGDAMISGSNTEISNRLTPIRRPGNSVYNSQSFTAVDYFYEFRLFNTNTERIKVMVDTTVAAPAQGAIYDGTGPSNQVLVYTKTAGAGQAYMQYVANILFFGDGIDQKKWVQTLQVWQASEALDLNNLQTFIIDPAGNIEQLIATVQTTVTHVSIASNVLTLTVGTTAGIVTGTQWVLWGFGTSQFLNGNTITITGVTGVIGGTVTAAFTHANGSNADTGAIAIFSGGTPVTGAVQPTWNVSSTQPNNTTIDNTAIWANRGPTIENWGIVGPTALDGGPVNASRGAGTVGWEANTFFSNTQVNVDEQFGGQKNIWQVTTKGLSGSTIPFTTNPTANVTTVTDGTVVWTCIASTHSSDSVWAASTAFVPPALIVANASGADSLFQVAANVYPTYKSPGVVATFYPHDNGHYQGQCELRNPIDGPNNPGVAPYIQLTAPATSNSVLFNPPQNPLGNHAVLQWATLTQAGDISGFTEPYNMAIPSHYTLVVTGTLTVPVAGQHAFTIFHDDGMFWGIGTDGLGNQAQPVSGPNNCPGPIATVTAANGLQVMGANNTDGIFQDPFIVNFPVAGDYPFEIDFAKSGNAGQFLGMYCQGQTPVPVSALTGTAQPVWPAFNTAFAPNYPTAQEKNNAAMGSLSGSSWTAPATGPGPISWSNLGPITDYAWKSKVNYLTTATTTIIDPNNNIEDPYEAGVTGTVEPTFATGKNQLTNDSPNLIWINQGGGVAPPSGTVTTLLGGWSYAIALVNSVTNTVSNAGPVSTATGNFVGLSGITITGGLPAVIDGQVDYVAIFRTDDGGATYFLIPGTQNSIYTLTLAQYSANGFVDTTPDSGLNILLEAPLDLQNTPPPVGLINLTYYLSRIVGSVGNTVYYSSGPDTPIGNGNEGFAPLNSLTFPSLVKRIVPTSIGALIFTVSDIYLVGGNGTSSSPLFSQPYANGIGLLSYNALTINGTTMYFFTADSQVVALDPSSGLSQVGFPIGDQFTLSNWNPANAYVTWHVSGSMDHALYVSDGSTGWFRMTPTAAPESGLTWSPFATIVGGCKAVQSIEVSPGVHRLLLGPTATGPILNRDLSTNVDNGVAYTANFQIGSIVLAQPGQIAELAFITTDSSAIGSKPTLSVLIDEIFGPTQALPRYTNDPPQLQPALSLFSQRFYFSQSQAPAICRHIQIQVSWPAEDAANELLAMTIFGSYMQED